MLNNNKIHNMYLTLTTQTQDINAAYGRNGGTFEGNDICHLDLHHLTSLVLPTPLSLVYTFT